MAESEAASARGPRHPGRQARTQDDDAAGRLQAARPHRAGPLRHRAALLLDEPTNHLDLDSIRWLEHFLTEEFKGVLVCVSHDRHFLNVVATHIADVDYKTITIYTGNYDDMVLAKTQIRSRIESRLRAAGEEDRAAERVHSAVRVWHPRDPGDVTPEGSGAARDHGPRALEHPAAVHPVRPESPVRPHGDGDQRRLEGVHRAHGDPGLHRRHQSRREDRPGRDETAPARRRC